MGNSKVTGLLTSIIKPVSVEMSPKPVAQFLVLICTFVLSTSQESCDLSDGKKGTCKLLTSCPEALQQIKKHMLPKICTFQDLQPVVCCEEAQDKRRSERKCLEYSTVNLPVESDDDPLITGGENAVPREFPHMAVLGYGREDNIVWQCGGSLISDQFVLTAAHCLDSANDGEVKYVRLGDLDLYNSNDDADPQQFNVIKTIPYQEYFPPASYHDIALLKLDKPARFTEFVRPACLQTEYNFKNVTLKATGWGALSFGSELHGFLQKVNLHAFAKKNCDVSYKPAINIPQGILDTAQVCAGSFVGGRDSCQGDSGGPLQMIIQNKPLMYKIVGVVSIGKNCGLIPALYTRVSAYITWIEENVWPN